jgi:hypothetical protein
MTLHIRLKQKKRAENLALRQNPDFEQYHNYRYITRNLFSLTTKPVLRIRIRCPFDPRIRDPGWVKPRSGSGMNPPDHISESLETIFWVKLMSIWIRDPRWKNSDPG